MSPFQAVKTWKTSTDPDYEAKKNRVLELYAIADGKVEPDPGDPTVVICMDEFGPLNLQPHPGRQWAPTTVGKGDPARPRRRRRRATYLRPNGIRHLLAGYDLATDRLYGHIKVRKTRVTCRNELRCTPADYPQPPWQCAYRRGLRELRRRLSVGKLAVWVRCRGGRARAVRSGCGRVVRERSLRTGAFGDASGSGSTASRGSCARRGSAHFPAQDFASE